MTERLINQLKLRLSSWCISKRLTFHETEIECYVQATMTMFYYKEALINKRIRRSALASQVEAFVLPPG